MVLSSGKGMKMKVQKYEIARVIDKLKSIVQKNDQFPALGGILVKDGYLIASNSEITMKVKLEASEGSYFIIPMKAFDLNYFWNMTGFAEEFLRGVDDESI